MKSVNDGMPLAVGLDCAPRRSTLIAVNVPQSRREEEEIIRYTEGLGEPIEITQATAVSCIGGL